MMKANLFSSLEKDKIDTRVLETIREREASDPTSHNDDLEFRHWKSREVEFSGKAREMDSCYILFLV